MTDPFSIRRGPPSPISYLRAFQVVVQSLETAVPAVPGNELIMMRPSINAIRVRVFFAVAAIGLASLIRAGADTIWLEAEWFENAQVSAQDGVSGGSVAVTNLDTPPATWDLLLPDGGNYRVWVRVADVILNGRRGVVRLNGKASPSLSGNASGLTWYPAGQTAGGEVRIELTGIEKSPADCVYDAVLVTDDGALDGDAITDRQEELRRAGWGGRGPRVALLHSDYSMGNYRPSAAWDAELAGLQCLVEKWPAARARELMANLGDYDVLLFTVMYRYGASVFWNDLGATLTPWLRDGGLLIVAGAREDADIGWLRNIHPAWSFGLGPCPTGMPVAFCGELRRPNALVDGLNERPHDYGRLPNPVWPDVRWQHFESGPDTGLVMCPCGKSLLVHLTLGKGAVVTASLFMGKGLDGRVFENLWAAHAGRLGRAYTPRPARPTLAEQLAAVPGPKGEVNPRLRFDAQGTLLIEDEPFFPFGFYCVRQESLKFLGDNGFNCAFGGGEAFLDEALERGIRVISSMSWDTREIPDSVSLYRRHPAFIGYGILEEPSNTPKTMHDMMRSAAVIRKCDPDKPRYVLPNNPAVFGTVAGMGEFIIVNPYCVRRPDSPITMVGDHVSALRKLHPGKPVWTLLQAHRSDDHLIIPGPAQLRAMNYLAIVQGARGVLWFAFDDDQNTGISFVHYADGHFEQPVWDTLRKLAAEMKEVVPGIVQPAAANLIAACGPEPTVRAAAWQRPGDLLLIVVNTMPDAQTARMILTRPVSLGTAHFGSTPASLSGDRLDVPLSGYGVGVYTLREE